MALARGVRPPSLSCLCAGGVSAPSLLSGAAGGAAAGARRARRSRRRGISTGGAGSGADAAHTGAVASSMAPVVELCSRRGFVFPGSSLYGGLASTFDYGPLGAQLKKNILDAWWRDFVELRPECVGLDTPIVMHPEVWRTSGHVEEFTDPLVQCNVCNTRTRADKLLEDVHGIAPEVVAQLMKGPDGERNLGEELTRVAAQCPACGSADLAEPVSFNLLFRTSLGAASVASPENKDSHSDNDASSAGGDASSAYLRPETAQGAYINFANVIASTARKRLPIGVGQVGKAFRNEISPGKAFLFRTREFELLELQWFYEGGDAAETEKWYKFWVDACVKWLDDHGVDPAMVRAREHHADELAHYAGATTDLEFHFPGLGWGELWGIADRGSFDLEQHIAATRPKEGSARGGGDISMASEEAQKKIIEMKMKKKKKKKKKKKTPKHPLEYVNPDDNAGPRVVPCVIEPALGLTRMFLAIMCSAMRTETLPDDGGERVVLKLHPRLAPVKVAVLPLVKNKPALVEKSEELHAKLSRHFSCELEVNGSIGRRYRRQDEIGTPICVTVDFDSVGETGEGGGGGDGTVTLRDRDSLKQVRVPIEEVGTVTSVEELLARF